MKASVAVAGASGYTGGALLRLLVGHSEFEVTWLGAHSTAGRPVGDVHPGLRSMSNLRLEAIDFDSVPRTDVLFIALPPGESMRLAEGNHADTKIVDLGPDFRIADPGRFEDFYGMKHAAPEAVQDWEYGLTEWNRSAISSANRVANPGCYPTAALLGLLPLAVSGAIGEGLIYVDGKSGLSGAGRSGELRLSLSEAAGDVAPYSVGGHRHLPEIEDQLHTFGGRAFAAQGVQVVFVPHLVPMARGLLTTCVVPLASGIDQSAIDEAYVAAYEEEPFVSYSAQPPHTKAVAGGNGSLISACVDRSGTTAVVTCAIDNLVKGAAGQAIQNANVMLGLPEDTGLSVDGLWP